MAKLSDSDLKALLQAERADSLASHQADKLTRERTRALDYYMGDISDDVPSVEGRSSAVSTDVSDTIEGLMPSLIEIFAGSDDAVKFEPVGPEDEDAANQETEYVRHIFWQKNDGFSVLYSMIKDALLTKLGIVKVFWEEDVRDKEETYNDQSDDQLAMILMSPDVEVVDHEPKDTGYPGPDGQPTVVHDVTIKRKQDYSCAKVMAVPPEEFGIARKARTIKDSHYCFHEPNGGRAVSDLIAEGYDKAQVMNLPSYETPEYTEKWARDTVDETNQPGGDSDINRAMRTVRITEHYIRMDYTGDGSKADLYKVITGGEDSTVLKRDGKPAIEKVDFMPFAGITPFIMPHRVFGRSVADVVMDIQRQKTVVLRGLLDNTYAANMPRPVVSTTMSEPETLDDLAVMRHGAPIRAKSPDAVVWQQVPPIINHVFPVLQYLDSLREWRTGVTRQGQGLDAEALNNQTATASMQLYNAAQARMKLIARVFAETGIKDMFWLLHATIRKNANRTETVRLLNNWTEIDPRNWKERNDLTVSVGLGQGGKAERLQEQQMIIGMQTQALQGGMTDFVKPKHLYNSGREVCRIMEKNVELFFEDPGDAEMPESQNPEEIKAQVEMAKVDRQAQYKEREMQMKAEIERLQAEADIATQDRKVESDIALAERKFQLDRELKLAEFQMQQELKALDMQMKAYAHELDFEKVEMGMVTDAQKAALDMSKNADKVVQNAKAQSGKEAPISKAISEMRAQQTKQFDQIRALIEEVGAEKEIEIVRDEKGKASGARTRKVKK